ncbi:hypothetical protein RHMOL_Rhmol05G0295800 [Rhododendron molle]|uniref:Uncharacterized protein n=1 Tax=Rhododendron molle TaxID=49168 RepID=A0ACC0NU79_RHOML|nr:hypothetical protein RHMOL_Rhmol05G0295800 [Rhododendron molle]
MIPGYSTEAEYSTRSALFMSAVFWASTVAFWESYILMSLAGLHNFSADAPPPMLGCDFDIMARTPGVLETLFLAITCLHNRVELNAIRLEEKEKREKELLREIIEQAEEYKTEFYRRRKLACENNKVANRKKKKVI